MDKTLERFLKYISFPTNSNPNSHTHPSSISQWALLKYLKQELEDLGLSDVYLSDEGFLYAHLKKNCEGMKTIGFCSHVDTSCDLTDENMHPKIIHNYDGLDIILNKEKNIVMKVSEYPFLSDFIGRTLITTDGTTLLGADDKAGISEIIGAIEYFTIHKDIPHGDIYVMFTPDEEIGEGTMFVNKDLFPCDYAYTVDGGLEGEINYENFNAASANVKALGINIHPGSAKDHMRNSLHIAMEFHSMLDPLLVPAKTEGYVGFNHLNNMSGNVEETNMHYIIRNHDMKKFTEQKQTFIDIKNKLNEKYQDEVIKLEITDSYYNMYNIVKDHMEVVEKLIKATKDASITPNIRPIRGGTDGAMLTYKGIITPNIGTAGFNFHGRYEGITLEGMHKVEEILINLIKDAK